VHIRSKQDTGHSYDRLLVPHAHKDAADSSNVPRADGTRPRRAGWCGSYPPGAAHKPATGRTHRIR